MWPVSPDFLSAIRGPHTIVSRVDVYYGGALIYQDLPVSAGSVTVNDKNAVRRTASLTVADPSLDPEGIEDMLAPVGTELLIRRGIQFGEGYEELVPLGIFRIDSVSRGSFLDAVSISASDRSALLQDGRFSQPWNTALGNLVVDEIKAMVKDVMPNVEFFDLTGSTAKTNWGTWEKDRLKAINELAKSIGAEAFFDPMGRFVLKPVAVNGAPVWDVDAGPNGVLLDYSTAMNREGVYNQIVAIGEAPTGNVAPITATATLLSGPLAYGGPFGEVPGYFVSSSITTYEQAQNAARSILMRTAGMHTIVEPTSIVNPALDVGDVINVVLPDGRQIKQIIRSFSVPLDPDGDMPLGTRLTNDDVEIEGLE